MVRSIEEYMKKHYPNNKWYYDTILSNKSRKIIIIIQPNKYKLYFNSYTNDKGEISWSPEDSNGFI